MKKTKAASDTIAVPQSTQPLKAWIFKNWQLYAMLLIPVVLTNHL